MNISLARPTEYRGVVFRSKSEAIFARLLELNHYEWMYEPKDYFALDTGWTPDFWAFHCIQQDGTPLLQSVLIEYKPSDVTDTYKAELLERFLQFWPDGMRGIVPVLVCGTPFDKSQPRSMERVTWIGEKRWVQMKIAEGWFFKNWDKAMETRFDLKSQPSLAQPLPDNRSETSL